MRERLRDGPGEVGRVERAGLGEQGDVRQVLHPRVRPRAREGVRVQLLRYVRLHRVRAEAGRGQPHERECVTPIEVLGASNERLAHRDVDPKRRFNGWEIQAQIHFDRPHPEPIVVKYHLVLTPTNH